jgi:hypothetical protein
VVLAPRFGAGVWGYPQLSTRRHRLLRECDIASPTTGCRGAAVAVSAVRSATPGFAATDAASPAATAASRIEVQLKGHIRARRLDLVADRQVVEALIADLVADDAELSSSFGGNSELSQTVTIILERRIGHPTAGLGPLQAYLDDPTTGLSVRVLASCRPCGPVRRSRSQCRPAVGDSSGRYLAVGQAHESSLPERLDAPALDMPECWTSTAGG